MSSLTHLDERGHAHMVNVGDKSVTEREALAAAAVVMAPATLELIMAGGHAKGDVFAVARIAGIQAAKRCADLIPLCHPLQLTHVEVELTPNREKSAVEIRARCGIKSRTGVEMEALTAVSVAALTIYDMCKAVDRGMVIESVRLLEKSGGASGDWRREEAAS